MAIKRLLLALALSATLIAPASAQVDDWLKQSAESIRETEESLKSLEGEAVFEVIDEMEENKGPVTIITGNAKVFYDRGKYHVHIMHNKRLIRSVTTDKDGVKSDARIHDSRYDEIFIIYDGKTAYEITFSDRISPTGCMGDIRKDVADSARMQGISANDPARLWRGNLEVGYLIKLIADGTVTIAENATNGKGSVTQRYIRPDAKSLFEVDMAPSLGYRITEFRAFNALDPRPAQRESIRWEQIEGQWHATKYTFEFPLRSTKSTFEYRTFQPNKQIDPKYFTLDSVDIPVGTRFIDRSGNGGNRFLFKAPDGLSEIRQNLPYFLTFDEKGEKLVAGVVGRYKKYIGFDKLRGFLESSTDRELKAIVDVCSLTIEQEQRLKTSFNLHNASFLRDVNELADELNANPIVENAAVRELFVRIDALNARFHESYLVTGSLGFKVLDSQLQEHQKQSLHQDCLSKFVEKIATTLRLSESQRELFTRHLTGTVGSDSIYIYDPQFYVDAIAKTNQAKLGELLGESQASFIHSRKSNSVKEFYQRLSDPPVQLLETKK